MNNQLVQQRDLAGKTKITTVTIHTDRHVRRTFFLPLVHDARGNAILPHETLNKLLQSKDAA